MTGRHPAQMPFPKNHNKGSNSGKGGGADSKGGSQCGLCAGEIDYEDNQGYIQGELIPRLACWQNAEACPAADSRHGAALPTLRALRPDAYSFPAPLGPPPLHLQPGTCSACGTRPFHFDCVSEYLDKV